MSDEAKRAARRKRIAEATYETGYGKPNKATQFKPGNQMAKRRRPKAMPDQVVDEVRKFGREKVTITVGGREVRVTRDQAVVHLAYQRVLTGGAREMKLWLELRKAADTTESANDCIDKRNHEAERAAKQFTEKVSALSNRHHAEELARARAAKDPSEWVNYVLGRRS